MIRFMKYYWLYFIISGLVILPGIYSLIRWGVKPSIDFRGGSVLELQTVSGNLSEDVIRSTAEKQNIEVNSVQALDSNTYRIRTSQISQETNRAFQDKLASESAATMKEKQFETLGPSLGLETLKKAVAAILLAMAGILLFVWWTFKDKKYGVCAVLAMLHDTLVIFSVFSLLGHFYNVEVDTLFMTAVLTILSFSVHDTIVVYDRIRESMRTLPKVPYELIVDKTVNETLSRSVNNSMTIIFMLLCLYLLGGASIKWFVFALLVGTVSGTYSSTFNVAPLLVLWDKLAKKK
jgi:preprotein translocase subunit SecF